MEHRTEGISKMLSPWLRKLRQSNWEVRRGSEEFSLSDNTGKSLIPFILGSLLGGRKGCSTAHGIWFDCFLSFEREAPSQRDVEVWQTGSFPGLFAADMLFTGKQVPNLTRPEE